MVLQCSCDRRSTRTGRFRSGEPGHARTSTSSAVLRVKLNFTSLVSRNLLRLFHYLRIDIRYPENKFLEPVNHTVEYPKYTQYMPAAEWQQSRSLHLNQWDFQTNKHDVIEYCMSSFLLFFSVKYTSKYIGYIYINIF